MASKNVIDTYVIRIEADARDAQKQAISAINSLSKKMKDISMKTAKHEMKIKDYTLKKKVSADKEYEVVQDALRKNNLEKEEAAHKRDIDLAKVAYKKKTSYIKQHVDKLTQSNNETLKSMKSFYTKMEKDAKDNASAIKKVEDKKEKRRIQKIRDRAKLLADRRAQAEKDLELARKGLMERLKKYKADKKANADAEEAKTRKIRKEQAARDKLLNKQKAIERTDYWQTLEKRSPLEAAKYSQRMNQAVAQGNVEALKDVAAEVRRSSRSIQRSMREMTFVQQGLHDSTKNMIRSYISLFALFEGTRAVKNVGMQFEGMRAGMLIAAKDSDDVMTKLRFVDKEATRLGLNLVETSKSFVKISAAAKGRMAESDIQEIFLGIAEAGTVMQLSMDDVNGTLRA